jgi:hypothetical protein
MASEVAKFWRDCQRHRPDGFDNVGWFLLCGALYWLVKR